MVEDFQKEKNGGVEEEEKKSVPDNHGNPILGQPGGAEVYMPPLNIYALTQINTPKVEQEPNGNRNNRQTRLCSFFRSPEGCRNGD